MEYKGKLKDISTAELIKETRKKEGITQEVVAKKVGVTRQQISMYETGATVSTKRFIEIMNSMGYEVLIKVVKKDEKVERKEAKRLAREECKTGWQR